MLIAVRDRSAVSTALLTLVSSLHIPTGQEQRLDGNNPLSIAELLPRDLEKGYFWYRGSLTTPPCSEVVHWMVFSKAIPISEKQVQVFCNLKGINRYGGHLMTLGGL